MNPATRPTEIKYSTTEVPAFRDEYILVVDDDWMNREVIEAYLQTAGYRVITANSGPKALEIAAQEIPSLVILDVNMPGMNGYELCSRLKSNSLTRLTPVMVVTALEADPDKLKAIEAGADAFLTKPFNSLIMMTQVKSLLRIRRLHDEVESRNALLRKVLNRYVNEDITEIILSDPDRHLQLGGESRMITVFFADIRGFTSFSEAQPAKQVVSVLNRIFSELTPIVFKYRGTLDKYVGDEIMGFFGAPVASESDAINAVRMAVEMQGVFTELQRTITAPSIKNLGLGIGIHTGEAAVGNVGSQRLMSYTVIGDTVNTASRLQQQAQGGNIVITESTYQQVAAHVEVIALDPLHLAGKSEPVKAYRLLKLKTTT
ncbi:MAG: response regulator [Chloroflexi bacterium]|nr:response regulator [Chloroflexota bacterium]